MTEANDKQSDLAAQTPRSRDALKWLVVAMVVIAAMVAAASAYAKRERLQVRLLQALPDAAGADPVLVHFAIAQAKPLYVKHCASCHGTDLRGNFAVGAPNLTDKVWLYGDGSVHEIERTLLYGIRSGQGKAHNVTDMPAFGLTGRLSDAEITNEVQYVLQLSGRGYQVAAANEGRTLYGNKGGCFDCHGSDAHGSPDYGAPDLTINVWNSGGDARSLYNAIYYGQHHLMPAWIGTLSLEQIRALAVYVHAMAQPSSTATGAY